MGPSVKFVSPISGLISLGKSGGKFFSPKKTIPGEGGGRSPKVHGPKVHKAPARAFDYFEGFRSQKGK